MLLTHIFEGLSGKRFVHGGPYPLEGDTFKRGGRGGHDMGALFFSEYTKAGIKYSMGYAIGRSRGDWALYIVELKVGEDKIFDFTNNSHRQIAKEHLSPQEFESWVKSSGSSGHLDWTVVDDELFEEMGFRACYFQERGAGVLSSEAIISVGVFNPSDVKIVGVIKSDEAKEKFSDIYEDK